MPPTFLVLVAALTVGGLLLRLPSFNDSLFGDEISTYFIVMGNGVGRVLQLVHSNQETSPPLYFLVAWVTKGWLSSPVQSIRLVSLVTGTAAIPLTFLLGLWTVGRRAGVVGAACVTLSPFMIFYSSEARPFMLVMFLGLVSTLALLRALDTDRLGWWILYALATCSAVYTHYTVVFLLVTQLVWALWTRPRRRVALVAANVAACLLYIPWLGGLRQDLHAPSFIAALAPVKVHTLELIFENFWIGHPLIPISLLPGRLAVGLAAFGLAVGVLGFVLWARTAGRTWWWRLSDRAVLVVALAVAPAVLVVLYSWARVDVLGGPFLISSWPAFALAIGALVVCSPSRSVRLIAILLVVGAYGVGAADMLGSAPHRPNIDSAVAYIDRVGSSGDPIVSTPYFANPMSELDVALANAGRPEHHPVIRLGSPPLAEQLAPLSRPHPQPQLFGLPLTPPRVVAKQAVALARHGTIFFLASDATYPPQFKSSTDRTRREFFAALPAGFHVVEEKTYPSFSGTFPQTLYVIRTTGSG
ncbi:MAG: glycosyltransferase family 39 protein [Acidimicrobiales bacterium]